MGPTTKLLRAIVALICFATSSSGSHVITVPKSWLPGGDLQVCVQVTNPEALQGEITVSIENGPLSANQRNTHTSLLMQESIQVLQGNQNFCTNITLPQMEQDSMLHQEGRDIIHINGTLDGLPVNYNRTISRQVIVRDMLVQTDKPLYKSGETVHFRVLKMSYTGPLMEISTKNVSSKHKSERFIL
ncbi:uncharacterized protein [Palaemon carinicauda]|uniref:uncharacterized protein n=1 Tax=Palaemon carinicauda TaxID=392227 RepID=UPI0035B67537